MVQMEKNLLGSILRRCLELSSPDRGSCGNEGWDQVGFCPNVQGGVGGVPASETFAAAMQRNLMQVAACFFLSSTLLSSISQHAFQDHCLSCSICLTQIQSQVLI